MTTDSSLPPPGSATGSDEAHAGVLTLLGHARSAARAHRRMDLDALLAAALGRLDRPDTVVLLAGEFKQGKSSLVNALIGVAACPVDDDLATAVVTIVGYGPAVEISIHQRSGGRSVRNRIEPAELASWVTEAGNPGNERGLEVVEIRAPNPMLERGWTFVDTPGIGGLNEVQAAAAMAFLPHADALLFVSDTSAELAANELEFLERARARCPTVLLAESKIDLVPAWRQVHAANQRLLGERALHLQTFPVSSILRTEALLTADQELNAESGVPALLAALQLEVMDGARRDVAQRAALDGRRALAQLRLPLEREATALRDPAARAGMEHDLAEARERLATLRGPAARWGQRLGDRFSDLAAAVDYEFRGAMRSTMRRFDEQVEQADPGKTWESMSVQLRADVAAAVGDVSTHLVEGAGAARAELAALITDESLATDSGPLPGLELGELWSGKAITRATVKSQVGMGFGALRGAQSGVYLIGMLGNLFSLAVIGPVLLGGAAIFAGKTLVDERRRQLTMRRQEARTAARQYLDDVQFEVGNHIRDLLREFQRDLRDDVARRLDELQRTYSETAGRLESGLKRDEGSRSQRLTALAAELRAIDDLDAGLARIGPGAP